MICIEWVSSTAHPDSFFRRWCRIFSDLDGLRTEKTHQRGRRVYVDRERSNFHHSAMTKPAAMTTASEEKSELTGELTEIKQLRFGDSRPAPALT